MKRGQPLRRSKLKPGKPLQRRNPLAAKSGLLSGASLPRRSPINPVSEKRRKQQPERTRVVNALREAQQGRCARCGEARVLHGHERVGMAHGASYVRPDVAVCDPCNTAVEDQPAVSAFNGWKISYKHPHDPALEPWQARALDGTVVDFTVPDSSEGSEAA